MASLDNQYISIGGQPILIDAESELRDFLQNWLTTDILDVCFQTKTQFQGDGAYVESSAYESMYPELPPLSVNQYQIPTGLSRYSRGLFLVDKISLAKIAAQAFQGKSEGVVTNWTYQQMVSQYPALFSDQPTATIEWGFLNRRVMLDLNFENSYTELVYCLRPIRIPFASMDAWLLPVVDYRYELQNLLFTKDDKPFEDRTGHTSYQEYINWAWDALGLLDPNKIAAASSAYGIPDETVLNSRKPVSLVVDAIALTLGYRYVPYYGLMDVARATVCRSKQLQSDLIIAGGLSGQSSLPEKITLAARKVRDWFGGYDWRRLSENDSTDAFPDLHTYDSVIRIAGSSTTPEGHIPSVACLWNVNIPTSLGSSLATNDKFEVFAELWTFSSWIPWVMQSLDVTYAGIPVLIQNALGPAEARLICGYDDYALIDLSTSPTGQQRAITRVRPMPNFWYPKFLVAQDPEDMTHYGPAFFIAEEDVPKAIRISFSEFRLGQKKAFFMVLKPDGANWRVKKTDVYANVHNSLGSTKAKANWPMQCKFIDGIWMIDVAECVPE